MTNQLKIISYGGGVQSTAMIVLAIQGEIDAQHAVFANVGDDSEHPASLVYVRQIMQPWAAERGFPIHEIQKTRRDGTPISIMGEIIRADTNRIIIPMRMDKTNAPGLRTCTADFKVAVISKWLKQHGANEENPAIVNIGISVDEIERAGKGKDLPKERRAYPLLDLGLNRSDCMNIISQAGLPVPPKSSCFFCPFHRPSVWQEMRRDEPDLFEKTARLEDSINAKRIARGKAPIWITGFKKPIRDAIVEAGDTLFDMPTGIGEAGCDEGVCFV